MADVLLRPDDRISAIMGGVPERQDPAAAFVSTDLGFWAY